MHCDYVAIPDCAVPSAVDQAFQHRVSTYSSEVNKSVSLWRAAPDDLHDLKPHEKTNTIRTILVHQLLSERWFFAEFAGLQEPPVEALLREDGSRSIQAYMG
jgi:hypothetical protein